MSMVLNLLKKYQHIECREQFDNVLTEMGASEGEADLTWENEEAYAHIAFEYEILRGQDGK